ncbi:MAG TPA: enoyl-CoA hydratase/isomerase family protein [Burkholderiaceae bacterium]|nr:enoyl-CoA hydratase/isomerase family protein [Burkholderiaceae bacterium]
MPTTLTYQQTELAGLTFGRCHLSSDSGVNPLSGAVVAQFRSLMRELDHDRPPHALVISAEGRCYCAGADLKEFRGFDAPSFRTYMSDVLAMYAEMIELRKPIVSLVHADARGGGAALALCSDFVISADSARFALPEAHRGLAGGGYLMPRLVGKQRAAEFVLLGREVSAAQMLEWGLVNEVCPADALEARARAFCEELARIPASAFAVGKQSLAAGLSIGLREAMARHVEVQTEAFVSARAGGLV